MFFWKLLFDGCWYVWLFFWDFNHVQRFFPWSISNHIQPFQSISIHFSQCHAWKRLRYRHPRSAENYGKVVFRHLSTIQKRLTDPEPCRRAWLRLLKDICDHVAALRLASQGKPGKAAKWHAEENQDLDRWNGSGVEPVCHFVACLVLHINL